MPSDEFTSQSKKLEDLTKLKGQQKALPSSKSDQENKKMKEIKEIKEIQDIPDIPEIQEIKDIKARFL